MRRSLSHILALTAYAAAALVPALIPTGGPVAPLWPAAGVGFAVLCVMGPAVFPTLLFTDLACALILGLGLPGAALLALGRTAGLGLGAWAVRAALGGRDPFSGIRTMNTYLLAGAVPAALVPALVAAWVLSGRGDATPGFAPALWSLFLSGFTAIVVLGPLVECRRRPAQAPGTLGQAEGRLMLAGTALVGWLVFGLRYEMPLDLYPLPFVFIPVIAWATFRADSRTLTLLLALLFAAAVPCTLAGLGPFGHFAAPLSLNLLQAFTAVTAVTTCIIHALSRERARAFDALKTSEAALREAKAELERRVEERTRKLGEALEELRGAEETYRTIFESAAEGIYRADAAGRFVRVNPGLAHMLGYASPTELKAHIRDIFRQVFTSDEDRRRLYQALTRSGQVSGFEASLRRRDGARIWASLSVRPVMARDGRILGTEGIIQDITQRKLTQEELERRATLDPLTETANRHTFERTFATMLAQAERTRSGLALLFIDLDDFKSVNDSLGHLAGDVILREMAVRIGQRLRKTDLLARLGGDEFAVLLHNASDPELAGAVAQDIIDALSRPFEADGAQVTVGASVGGAVYPGGGSTTEALLRRADRAMYKAKQHGKNRYHIDTQKAPAPGA